MSRQFPVITPIWPVGERGNTVCPVWIDWDLIAPHEKQADWNHGQTLRRLARRGLSPAQLVAILEDRNFRNMPTEDAVCRLKELIDYRSATSHRPAGPVSVSHCNECPMANWSSSECHHPDAGVLEKRTDVPDIRGRILGPDDGDCTKDAPQWCPLRKRSLTITRAR